MQDLQGSFVRFQNSNLLDSGKTVLLAQDP